MSAAALNATVRDRNGGRARRQASQSPAGLLAGSRDNVRAFFHDLRARGWAKCFARAARPSPVWPTACEIPPSRSRPICDAASYQAPSRAIPRGAILRRLRCGRAERSPALRTISRRASSICTYRSAIGALRERCLFVEERQRLKIVANGFGVKPVLNVMFGALICVAERWRGLRFTEFKLRRLAALQLELDQEYEARWCR